MVENNQEKMIDKQTKLFGFFADSASSSKLPLYFKKLFNENGVNASYIPMNIREDDIYFTVSGMKQSQINGVNITPEYAKIVYDLIDKFDEESKFSGVFTTITRDNDKLFATNNVSKAVFQKIKAKKIGIIGLGSLAKSLIFQAKNFGIEKIVFYHDSVEKIAEFIENNSKYLDGIELDIERITKDIKLNSQDIEVLINATYVGSVSHDNQFDLSNIKDSVTLLDLFENKQTYFEKIATDKNLTYIGLKDIEQEMVKIDFKDWIK